jgi:hypothetical protein
MLLMLVRLCGRCARVIHAVTLHHLHHHPAAVAIRLMFTRLLVSLPLMLLRRRRLGSGRRLAVLMCWIGLGDRGSRHSECERSDNESVAQFFHHEASLMVRVFLLRICWRPNRY